MVTRIHAAGSTGQRSPGLDAAIAVWHAESPDSRERYGTGSPNGVVTANPGTYYTDTAGTNGAWRWLKKTGTGNTGWVVLFGDTGWRDISSLLLAGWSGTLLIRRIGSVVELETSGLVGPSTSAGDAINLPSGFHARPNPATVRPVLHMADSNATPRRFNLADGYALRSSNSSMSAALYGGHTWTTIDAWPAILPGTPA